MRWPVAPPETVDLAENKFTHVALRYILPYCHSSRDWWCHLGSHELTWYGFHKWDPQNGWFRMENLAKIPQNIPYKTYKWNQNVVFQTCLKTGHDRCVFEFVRVFVGMTSHRLIPLFVKRPSEGEWKIRVIGFIGFKTNLSDNKMHEIINVPMFEWCLRDVFLCCWHFWFTLIFGRHPEATQNWSPAVSFSQGLQFSGPPRRGPESWFQVLLFPEEKTCEPWMQWFHSHSWKDLKCWNCTRTISVMQARKVGI